MTNKVKPFFIRITDEMTPQMAQDAFDKCVDAGAVAGDCVDRAAKRNEGWHYYGSLSDWKMLGVCKKDGTYLADDESSFSGNPQEITLDQLDEWLGLEVEKEWKLGEKCVLAGNEYTFGCINPVCDQGSVVIFDDTGDYHGCCINELSKPETPEQKAEREKKEAIDEIKGAIDFFTDSYMAALSLYEQGYRKK